MSPKTVIATVRGIGVAVMTRTCGGLLPLLRRASRCSTPKRCCSSTTTRPRSANCTCSWIRACVPIDDARLTGCRRRAATCLRAAGALVPGQQRHLGAVLAATEHAALGEVAEHRGDRAVVLRGKDLGGRQQRRLPAGVDHRRASPAAPRRSCPSRPRPAAAGASGARWPGRRRSPR